jgi:hypothetical protein
MRQEKAGKRERIASERRLFDAEASQGIHRSLHSAASVVQHVGVDHRRLQLFVPQELLDRPDVIATH